MLNKLNWDSIGRVCVYLLFGLVPVFFLPFTAFPVAENKVFLAGVLVLVAFGAFLAQTLQTGKISFAKTKFWFALAAFLIIIGISTFFSAAPQTSFWGGGTAADSFFAFFIYGLAVLLIPLYLREARELVRALVFFSISLFVLSVFSLLQFFGIFVLPLAFAQQVSFNPIGTVQALSIFLGSGLVMLVALLASFRLSGGVKVLFGIGGVILSVILVLVNFSYVWLGILLSAALIAAWQIMHSKRGATQNNAEIQRGSASDSASFSGSEGASMLSPKFGLPFILMIIVAILFFVQPPISAIVRLPAEVRPSVSATLDIAQKSLSSDIKNAALGSGPGTFVYEYLLHRSSDLNSTAFWGVRFQQGYAALPTFLITLGLLGVVSLVVMLGFFIWLAFRGIATLSRKNSPLERVALISLVSFLFLLSAWFFYPANFSIMLFTFLFAGMVISALRVGGAIESWDISLLATPQRTFAASLVIIVLIVSSIVGLYWHGQKYVASVVYAQGVRSYNQNRDVARAIEKVELARSLDNSRDIYQRTFAQLVGLRAQELLSNQTLDAAELQRRYQVLLQGWIRAGQEATKLNTSDPLNWRELGSIYENNIRIVGGADQFAIANYKKAAEANPQNPTEYLNIGRAYVLAADALQTKISNLSQEPSKNKDEIGKLQATRTEHLANAIVALQKSINLKKDYAPAHFLSSQVYERQGERKLAIGKTLETRDLNPLDTGVGYQLGLLYYLDEQLEKAKDEFARVVALQENFSNARYFLGLSYSRLGNRQGAIDQFTRVQQLNPDNSEAKQILGNLQAGRSALAGISPPGPSPTERIEPPVSETGGEATEVLGGGISGEQTP